MIKFDQKSVEIVRRILLEWNSITILFLLFSQFNIDEIEKYIPDPKNIDFKINFIGLQSLYQIIYFVVILPLNEYSHNFCSTYKYFIHNYDEMISNITTSYKFLKHHQKEFFRFVWILRKKYICKKKKVLG